jgi:hypothetical protein
MSGFGPEREVAYLPVHSELLFKVAALRKFLEREDT